MKNKDRSSSYWNILHQQFNKPFCKFCKYLGHNIETCYHCNKSVVSISTAIVASTESVQPMAPISAQFKSFGSTITISTVKLQNIIANTICMVGNASYFSSLSILSSMSPSSWLIDSACCNHTTPYSSLFSQLDPTPHPLNICTTYVSTMFGHNIGSISTSNLWVPGVFNVPNLLLQFIFCETISWIELLHYLWLFWVYCVGFEDRTEAWDRSQSWTYVSRGQPLSSTYCSHFCCCFSFFYSFPYTLACPTWSYIFLLGTSLGF